MTKGKFLFGGPGDPVAIAIQNTGKNYHGGARQLAIDIGSSPGTFANKTNPNMENHHINIHEMREIMHVSHDYQILYEVARETDHVCVPLEDFSGVSDMELLNAWAAWDAERGETGQAIQRALEDSSITDTEIDKIEKEMFEDFQKELELLNRLKSLI